LNTKTEANVKILYL